MSKIRLLLVFIIFLGCQTKNKSTNNDKIIYWISQDVDNEILKGINDFEMKTMKNRWKGNTPILFLQTFDINELGVILLYEKDSIFNKFTEKTNNFYRIKENKKKFLFFLIINTILPTILMN
ncbi:hypothetical protein [Mesonia oceanica]|uniref:Uncharacterized protein n=1 Tax=Mesonia oceanica TaxID=2687242 RepID=A0AC61Y4X2_9FLAO|nr:hypothetical protein [Mesonia oceanica]MAQ40890.1 hypothetical protein [Mesonia sp.]MBJ97811.1 hypothetical protein [Flavobacteriaceae bacterium]VVU99519.1 hypothetical protein FVB9532_00773 [Mesonia oceanica]|tara:strand:+ start:510 stop:875 length:366 start_codon:yes stop_codon:yes gene_type:complete